jgi:alkanesulfonate monooxygenase SsuD/methylene tetrahydromethanopterin reductase-like flavin-dependent oxidoreductase (luciferase family)
MPNNVAIGVGTMEFPFSSAAAYWRWVDLCEAGGIDSIWQTDRLVNPQPFLECMSVMAALAGRTKRIKFGVNVLSLAMRDAVLVARQCATIDYLSNGRLLPAFGIGSPLGPEWTTLNLDTKTRGRKTDEGLEVIRRLWAEDSVDFEGVHYHLSGASLAPKPVQPDLPMWIGGSSEAANRPLRHRLAGRPRDPGAVRRDGRRDQEGGGRRRPQHRRRPLRRRHPVPFRQWN